VAPLSENVIDEMPPYSLVDCVETDHVMSSAPVPVSAMLLNVKSPAVRVVIGEAQNAAEHSNKPSKNFDNLIVLPQIR
jgi:hypothetical protein